MSATIHPREQAALFGHETAWNTLKQSWNSTRMPHAWLISGERGIGKATLCYRFARQVLAGTTELEHPAVRRMLAGSHGDLLVVEPAWDEKKDEAKREISVEQARAIAAFLSMTPMEGGWRVAIVDSADELTISAANAILKTVEEPPPRALLLLISHNPGRLLPTIRSRCRALKMPPLSASAFAQAMRRLNPELEEDEISLLGRLSRHSIGQALELHAAEGLEMYATLLEMFSALPQVEARQLAALSEQIFEEKQHARWLMAGTLVQHIMALGAGVSTPKNQEIQTVAAMQRLWPARHWAQRHALAAQQFSLAARAHLDYKSTLTAFFHSLPQPMNPWNQTLST